MCAGSSSGGSCVCEKKTGAGEAGFGFLEFGDVDGSDVEATGFDAGTCARERCRENDGVLEGQGIGCMRLCGIDVDPFMSGKLADAFGVAAPGKADKELAADAKDVATFESAGKRNVLELSKRGERLSQ